MEERCGDFTEHYDDDGSNVKLISLAFGSKGLGIRLSKSSWDPYPFVSHVDVDSVAQKCGLQTGDCILKVNTGFDETQAPKSITHNKRNKNSETKTVKLSRSTDKTAWEGRYKTSHSRFTIKQTMTMKSIYSYGARIRK